MFVSRNNQENAVYAQQTTTAAKNDALTRFAPKQPAAKNAGSPTKASKNDENLPNLHGNRGGKGKSGDSAGDVKPGKSQRLDLVTPSGPRTRAPLGNKTTNAKAKLFQTPAPFDRGNVPVKPASTHLQRGKLKINTAEPELNGDVEPAEREIEYMPPRETPLPDHPEDCWPHDRKYPQFEGLSATRGWLHESAPSTDDDDDSGFSKFEEKMKKFEARQRSVQSHHNAGSKPLLAARNGAASKAPSTLSSRHAATAFGSATGITSNSGTHTTASRAKASVPPILSKKIRPSPTIANHRHTVAKAASNTTLGYSKGRSVSAARQPLSDVHRQSSLSTNASGMPYGGGTTLDDLLGLSALTVEDAGDDNFLGWKVSLSQFDEEEEALQEFQLEAL